MRETFLLLILMAFAGSIQAQKVKMVSAIYTYYAPENISIEDAKRTAFERAKIEAIANEFGSIVSQSNSTVVSNRNGETDSQFYSFGGSEVKGEWIETIGEPKYEVQYSDKTLVVKCSVRGKAREIETATIEFISKPLRNGTDLKFEATEFHDGDDLYLYFQTPISGYLAVYLLDEFAQIVYCILPYKSQSVAAVPVEAEKRYVFFSEKDADMTDRNIVDEYTLQCENEKEFNTLYVLFSPSEIGKRTGFESSVSDKPDNIPLKDFKQWLSKTLSWDRQLQFKEINIAISKLN